ncbi:MAG: DMT family transporter [Betaproteobacteria bacterium]|nr:DMT family transporter [Betaproteobacteria bacterium]
MMVALAVLWGGSYFWSAIALRDMPPFAIVAARLTIGAVLLMAYVRSRGHSMVLPLALWRDLFVLGFLNLFLPFCLVTWGQTQIASGLAAIFNATAPLFAVVVAHFATRDERLTVPKLAGVLLGIAGVAVMVGVDALRGLGLQVIAQLAVLCGAMSYGLAAVYARRFRNQPSMVVATGQITGAAVMSLPVALFADQPWAQPVPSLLSAFAVVAMGILSTAVSPLLYFAILKSVGATNAIVVTFLAPVSALILGIVILGEAFTAQQAGGIVLIGLGLAVIDGRPFRRARAALARG